MRLRAAIFLILALALPWVLTLCHGADLPPMPPKVYPKKVEVKRGAELLIQKKALAPSASKVIVIPWRTNVADWHYSSGIVPNNYWWNLETRTTDAWTVAQSNVGPGVTVTNNKAEAFRFYRLHGRLTP